MDTDLLPQAVLGPRGGSPRLFTDFLTAASGEIGNEAAGDSSSSLFQIMEGVERRVIVEMLERTNWNQTEASERFQIPLSTLNQKIKRLGIETRRRGLGRAADSAAQIAGK